MTVTIDAVLGACLCYNSPSFSPSLRAGSHAVVCSIFLPVYYQLVRDNGLD